MENDDIRLLFDPIFENPFSVNCHAYPNVRFDLEQIQQQTFTAIFISHHHDDHCCLESLALLPRMTPLYLYCGHKEIFDWLSELGFQQVYPLELNTLVTVGKFQITPRAAVESDVDCLFEISCENLNILNVVDAAIDPEIVDTLSEKSWDMILWPFQIMRERDVLAPSQYCFTEFTWPEEWIYQLQKLKPLILVPSACQFIHEEWSWYRQAFFPVSYKMFTDFARGLLPKTQVQRINPGESFLLTSGSLEKAEPLSWINPLGEQNVDYEFNPKTSWSSTADIALRFPPLNKGQQARVSRFCREDIIQRYYDIGPSPNIYFQKKRVWRLTVYDHSGHEENFYYLLQDEHLEILASPSESFAWHTQIPAQKLYAALEEGETLSSLYLRVNENLGEKLYEESAELEGVDIMEDPLIRLLYTGVFASYQKNQLQRLRKKL